MAKIAPYIPPSRATPVQIPAGLSWDSSTYPFRFRTTSQQRRNFGYADGVQDFLEDHFADCLAATPIYVVFNSGNDSTGSGSLASPYQTIRKAIEVANASAAASHIRIAGGTAFEYNLTSGFSGSTISPTVKTVFTAYNGRVRSTTKPGLTWSTGTDSTYTNCYTASRTGADIARLTARRMVRHLSGEFGQPIRLLSAALVDKTPGSWCQTGTTIYYHPFDGLAPTNSNVFCYETFGNLRASATTPVSLWLRGETPGDGFDFEGGNTGAISCAYTTVPASRIVIAVDDCTFRYTGAATSGTPVVSNVANTVNIDSVHGIFIARNSGAGAGLTDLWNFHNFQEAEMYVLTLNCTGDGAGGIYDPTIASPPVSNNLWTAHEDVIGIDIAGYYTNAMGRALYNINTSKMLAAGTIVEGSIGDRPYGGGFEPVEYAVSNTAKMWLDRAEARPFAAGKPTHAMDETAEMYLRNCPPVQNYVKASGATFGTW